MSPGTDVYYLVNTQTLEVTFVLWDQPPSGRWRTVGPYILILADSEAGAVEAVKQINEGPEAPCST